MAEMYGTFEEFWGSDYEDSEQGDELWDAQQAEIEAMQEEEDRRERDEARWREFRFENSHLMEPWQMRALEDTWLSRGLTSEPEDETPLIRVPDLEGEDGDEDGYDDGYDSDDDDEPIRMLDFGTDAAEVLDVPGLLSRLLEEDAQVCVRGCVGA